MAEVFLVTPQGRGGPVAIKRPLASMVAAGHEDLFLREAALAVRLKHPNLVGAHRWGRDDHGPFLEMEYVPGLSVCGLLDNAPEGRFEPLHALEIASQVAEALAYLEDSQVVHRDLSPANVMVGLTGQVKLLDFGVALWAQSDEPPAGGPVRGKLIYMSPEQSRGDPVDARSDQFALGILLAEMLGRHPFWTGALVPSLWALQQGQLRLPSERDSSLVLLDGLLRRLLAPEPSARFESAHYAAVAVRSAMRFFKGQSGPLGEWVQQVAAAPLNGARRVEGRWSGDPALAATLVG